MGNETKRRTPRSITSDRDRVLSHERNSAQSAQLQSTPPVQPASAHSHNHTSFHTHAEFHHGHSHATGSQHTGGHHLLQVEDLSISFRMYDDAEATGFRNFLRAHQHEVSVIHNLNVSVHPQSILAIVGASGSGKTLLADAIMGIYESNALVTGRIWFDGELQTAESLRQLRGSEIALIPQSVNSLDPLMRVGKAVQGVAKDREDVAYRRARQEELFERFDLAPEVARMYPHELSGGMARRVLLCCALMGSPKLIIADEPTPGLDLPLAVQALSDLRSFADEGGAVMLITHDIELALSVADSIAVFKDGTVIEETSAESFADEQLLRHEFTRALWRAMPEHGFAAGVEESLCPSDSLVAPTPPVLVSSPGCAPLGSAQQSYSSHSPSSPLTSPTKSEEPSC